MATMASLVMVLALSACVLAASAQRPPGPDSAYGPPGGLFDPPQPGPPVPGPGYYPPGPGSNFYPPVPPDWISTATAPKGVNSSATGKLELFARLGGNYTFYGTLSLHNITGFTMAHIHLANGSVALWLFPDGAPSGPFKQPISGTFTIPFEVDASDLQYVDNTDDQAGYKFADLLNTPGATYLNVHTVAYPGGELKGNITKSNPFGQGRKMLKRWRRRVF